MIYVKRSMLVKPTLRTTLQVQRTIVLFFSTALIFVSVASARLLWTQAQVFDQSLSATTPACGCTSLSVFNQHPMLLIGLGIATSLVLIAFIFTVIQFISSFFKTRRFEQTLQSKVASYSVFKGYTIWQVKDDTPYALTLGWLQPRIYVSSATIAQLDPFALVAVLEHEVQHAYWLDPLWQMFLEILPVRSWKKQWRNRALSLTEIAADQAVTHPMALRQAIVSLHQVATPVTFVPTLSIARFAALASRIDVLLGEEIKPVRWWRSLIIGSVLLSVLGFAYSTLAHPQETSNLKMCLAEQPMCEALMTVNNTDSTTMTIIIYE